VKNNLYEKLTKLVDRQWELKRLGGIVKHDLAKRDEYRRIAEEYNNNDESVYYILKNCYITPLKLADIISEQEKDKYVLKIFRETDENPLGETYYTSRFIICYLNNKNEFFDSNENPIAYHDFLSEEYINNSLSKENFKKLFYSLTDESLKIVSTHEDISFIPTLSPSFYLDTVNFTDLFVYGKTNDIISRDFQEKAKEYMKTYLEQIDAEEFLSKATEEENEKGQ